MLKREKYILVIAVIAVGILVGDRYILTPLLNNRQQLQKELTQADDKLNQVDLLLRRKDVVKEQFQNLQRRGLTSNIEQLESAALRFIKDSSQSCNVNLSSVQPDVVSPRVSLDGLGVMEFGLSASGTMEAITRFLWKMETAQLPLMIVNIQLASNDETGSNMNLQLRLSSVYLLEKSEGSYNE